MRKWIAALCAVALCLGLALPAALAADPAVYHMVVNDKFADGDQINPATMPIVINYSVYVAATVFDRDSTGVNLGTASGTRKENGLHILTVYSREITLYFEINSGACWDSQGNNYDLRAVVRNNVTFVPADATCKLLGVDFTYFPTSDRGVMIRITNGSQALTNDGFVDSSRVSMLRRYSTYLRSLTPSPAPSTAPNTQPTPTPSPTPGPGEPTDRSDVTVLLAFRCATGEGLPAILDDLPPGLSALFLFPVEDLAQHDAVIRRMAGEGHTVGLITDAADEAEALAELEAGNRLLERIAWQRTRVVLAEGGDKTLTAALEASGWRCWQGNVDAATTAGGPAANANRILAALDRLPGRRARITMDDSAAAANTLPRLLAGMRASQYAVRSAVDSQI